jgi:uncharacterized protein (DUF433 family)
MRGKRVTDRKNDFLGIGLYSITDAAALSGVTSQRVRRWVRGYSYTYRGTIRHSKPVWELSIPVIDGTICLSFLDLIEIQFVNAFLNKGLSWKSIRRAESEAAKQYATPHPFATGNFKTDGFGIFGALAKDEKDRALVDLVKSQYAFEAVVAPYFLNLEIEKDRVVRWWPLGTGRAVVIDPLRRFGHPITEKEGIPTSLLAQAVKTNGSVARVAAMYDASVRSVSDAVAFENEFASGRKAA